jgi:hypothetical protein
MDFPGVEKQSKHSTVFLRMTPVISSVHVPSNYRLRMASILLVFQLIEFVLPAIEPY